MSFLSRPIVTSQDQQDLENRRIAGSSAKQKGFPSNTDMKSFMEYQAGRECGEFLPDGISTAAHCPEQDNISRSPFAVANVFAEKDLSVMVVWFLLY